MGKVLVVIGSESDKPRISSCLETLKEFGVEYKLSIASAHRSPHFVRELAESAQVDDYSVIIAAAGMAAALPGALAAHTIAPVVGIPLNASALNGVDALYAIAQMPPGIPVATVAIDGARNGALLAIEILAINDANLRTKLEEYRQKMRRSILEKNGL